jgi:hypothetical protein
LTFIDIKLEKPKQIWHCAVKNTTTSQKKWSYHLFYDFDSIGLEDKDISWINTFMTTREMSFILRESQHGYHLIGLTPIDSYKWGLCFNILQNTFPTYHDGQAIRITKKQQNEFNIVASNLSFPYTINLAKCFKVKDSPENLAKVGIKEGWYVLLYYTTNKKNVKNKEVVGQHALKEITS